MPPDPGEPFRILRDKLEEVTAPFGLKLIPQAFSIIPGEDHLSPMGAHALFEIDPDALRSPEDRATKEEFDQMMVMEKEMEFRDKAAQAREKLIKNLEAGGGFLDDTPDE